MVIVLKSKVDNCIRLYKKYYSTGDRDLLSALSQARKDAFGNNEMWVDRIITGIAIKRKYCDEPYETYYKVLRVLEFDIVEDKK